MHKTANNNRCCHSLSGCHIAVGNMSPTLNVAYSDLALGICMKKSHGGKGVLTHPGFNNDEEQQTLLFVVWLPCQFVDVILACCLIATLLLATWQASPC
jgi:hypothetical protein